MNNKPKIDDRRKQKWQEVIDLMAKILDVPAGLIMKVHSEQIEVFLTSNSKNNPYELGEMANLKSGLYCEMVMATRKPLLVPNALKDINWMNNPDIKLNMTYYLGYPLIWPDGHIFGTICILDSKDNKKATEYSKLIEKFKDIIEADMEIMFKDRELEEAYTSLIIKNNRFNKLKKQFKRVSKKLK